MSEQRRNWAGGGEPIMRILRRHLVDREDVSMICAEEKIQPSQFYKWQAQLFAEGAAVFQRKNSSGDRRERIEALEKIAKLEEKLGKKNEVLSELMEEHVQLKKELGEN